MQEGLQRLPGPEVAAVSDHAVPGPHGDVPVRVYVPIIPHPPEGNPQPGGEVPASAGTTGLPVCMWFHGGGWIYGSVDSNDATCRALANAAGAIVVSVDYRLAPENKFPVPFDDSYVLRRRGRLRTRRRSAATRRGWRSRA